MTALKAFVSSTFTDLKAHRARAIALLRGGGVHVDPMENWSAANEEPKTFCLERMKDCSLCILLVAFRKGFIPDGETLSITQMEYQYALDHREEALAYAMQFARDLDAQLADKFVGMYVNERTLDYGRDGREAVRRLLDLGHKAGIIPQPTRVDFAA